MTENSFMLIHQLSTGIYGKYEEIKDDFENDTKFMERLYKLYRENTTMNDKKVKEVLSHDRWWTADECISNGLVDGLWRGNKGVIEEVVEEEAAPRPSKKQRRRL
jgi:ATP-dependent protease ClpP protease subunit